MNDGQSTAIWLTGCQDRSIFDIVELARSLEVDDIVDICDVSAEIPNLSRTVET